jgi:hypothetical protein
MKRLAFTLLTILAAGPFNQKLNPDQQLFMRSTG